jgi:hypothetical protein
LADGSKQKAKASKQETGTACHDVNPPESLRGFYKDVVDGAKASTSRSASNLTILPFEYAQQAPQIKSANAKTARS